MERPFADKRLLGPFAQRNRNFAEVNVYFGPINLDSSIRRETEEAVEEVGGFKGDVEGPLGVREDVLSLQTVGNTTDYEDLAELKRIIEDKTGETVENIEVIW